MTSREIELALFEFFNPRCVCIPRVSWGMGLHECDMLVLTESGYGYEVEIKVSLSDLKADQKKRHQHFSGKLRRLYFAIPSDLFEKMYPHIPEEAGIITVAEVPRFRQPFVAKVRREAKARPHTLKFREDERLKLYRLGTLKMQTLTRRVVNLEKRLRSERP